MPRAKLPETGSIQKVGGSKAGRKRKSPEGPKKPPPPPKSAASSSTPPRLLCPVCHTPIDPEENEDCVGCGNLACPDAPGWHHYWCTPEWPYLGSIARTPEVHRYNYPDWRCWKCRPLVCGVAPCPLAPPGDDCRDLWPG